MTGLRRSRAITGLALLLTCSLVLAASPSGASPKSSSGGASGAIRSAASKLKYGASAEPGGGITYEPDVVFVGGAGSVTSVSSNGLVWTINGAAPNVGELKPGKILFASSLGVGRILAISKSGNDKKVVLGPVSLTDIVRDGTFASQAPLPLSSVQGYTVQNAPGLLTSASSGSSTPASGSSSGDFGPQPLTGGSTPPSNTLTVPPVRFVADVRGQPPAPEYQEMGLTPASGGLPSPSSSPSGSTVGAYHLTPFCCDGGVGVHVGYNDNGLKMSATVTLQLDKPTVGFDLKIVSGKLVNAAVELHGAGGFKIAITATSTTGNAGDVKNQRVQIPVDFSVPIPGFGIPLTVGFDQVFGLSAAFTAHPSAFTATGNYTFGGSLGFGLHNGSPTVYSPQGVTTATNPSNTMNLVSVGPAAVLINYQGKVSVGVGLLGFRTGVWFALAFNTGLTESGATSAIACRNTAFAIFAEYGVGYSIPKSTAALVNKFLQVFHAPPIQASGGYMSSPITLVKRNSIVPGIAACA